MARIVIFGGTGYSGSNIAREAVRRGHEVVSYARNAPAEPLEGVEYRTGSMADPSVVDAAAQGADHLVVALKAEDVDGQPMVERVPALVAAARRHGARLSFVGGAASSLVAEGGPRLLDTPDFREERRPEATAHAADLDAVRPAREDVEWVCVSPAGRYGCFRSGRAARNDRT